MTVEKELVSEIEEAVEQSIEDNKSFVETEEKEYEPTAQEVYEADLVEAEEANKKEENKKSNEEGQRDDEEVVGEISETESGGTSNEDGRGKEGEPEGSQATPGSPEAPAISEGALELAIRSGFTVTEANSFGNENALLKAVQIINERSVPAAKVEEKKELLLSDLPDLDSEQYEPEAIETFKKMKGAIQEQQKAIEQLTQEAQASNANQAAQNEREITAWFDRKIAGLGDGYEKALGKGSHGSLSRGSSQFAKREEIADHINLMAAGYSSTGREQPSLDSLFDQSAKFILRDETNEAKEKKLSDRLRKRAKQHIARNSTEKVGSVMTEEAAESELASEIESKFFKGK